MTVFQDFIFIAEIELQSKIIQRAAERLQYAIDKSDKVEIWSALQTILISSGNISKILWPKEKYEERGNRLRGILKVENNNPIKNREFRNKFFEHYDEMVDDWFKNNSNGVYIDLAMNPSLFGDLNTHRGYNSFDNTLIIRGKKLDLNSVLLATENIRKGCESYMKE